MRAIPGGFQYVSPGLSLDLTRYGIVLRDARALPPDVQKQLLRIIDTVARELGFVSSGQGVSRQLPQPGQPIAVHRRVRELDAAAAEALSQAEREHDDPQSSGGAEERDVPSDDPDIEDDDTDHRFEL